MDDRTLEARLTARLLVAAGAVLVVVGVAAVVVTDRLLDAGDTRTARTLVSATRSTLQRELEEGDGLEVAIAEVMSGAGTQGLRLTIRAPGVTARASGPPLDALAAGTCATSVDGAGVPWRACGDAQGSIGVVAAISIEQHRQAVSALGRGMLVVVLLSLAALWFAVRRAVRAPVAELAALVRWTAQVLDAEQPAGPPDASTREVAQLGRSFEVLVRRLLDALARERASSAHIAHELRTPLSAMLADLDTLAVPGPTSGSVVRRIRADVTRLVDVVEAILVLSSNVATRSESVVNVADLARELAPQGARVEAPDEALVEADEPLVVLALRNLIDNATRYGGGVKAIEVSRAGGALRLAVVDEGPGLAEDARAHMFDRYWRGSADGGGRGLGLALVKAVADRHGGQAHAEPGPSGGGLRVSMTLGAPVGWHEHERGGG